MRQFLLSCSVHTRFYDIVLSRFLIKHVTLCVLIEHQVVLEILRTSYSRVTSPFPSILRGLNGLLPIEFAYLIVNSYYTERTGNHGTINKAVVLCEKISSPNKITSFLIISRLIY